MTVITFDFEATTKNKGNPFTASNKSVSYSLKVDDGEVMSSYFTDIEYTKLLRDGIGKAKLLVGFNIKYDIHWARRLGVLPPAGVRVWDCQIAEFLIRGQIGSYPSLNEACARFDLGQKLDQVSEYWKLGISTIDIPRAELIAYNKEDVELTYRLYLKQKAVMSPKLQRLCMVMGLDLLVLAEMEWNGVKLDVELCKQKAEQTAHELKVVSDELYSYSPTPHFNFDSGHQLSCLLYGGGFEVTYSGSTEERVYKSGFKEGQVYTKTNWITEGFICDGLFAPIEGSKTKLVSKANGNEYPVYSTNEDVLKRLKAPTKKHKRLIELLLIRAEKEKLLSTYFGALPNFVKEMEWGDILHGNLNQCVARTGRLSSSNPNTQNFSGAVDEVLVSRYC